MRRLQTPAKIQSLRAGYASRIQHPGIHNIMSYRSDITDFIESLKERDPGLEARQRAGRARYWDKELDPEVLEAFRQAQVAQKPYVYQTE